MILPCCETIDAEGRQPMSYSIATLLTRNLSDVFENDPARQSKRSSPKIVRSTNPEASIMAAMRSIGSRARSRPLTLTFDISQLPSLRKWAMAAGSNGYRARRVTRQLTPGLISSLPETVGLLQFISFSTSYPELDHAVRLPCGVGLARRSRPALPSGYVRDVILPPACCCPQKLRSLGGGLRSRRKPAFGVGTALRTESDWRCLGIGRT